jgi:hypothetical protein
VIEARRSMRRQWPEVGQIMMHRGKITHRAPNFCLGGRGGEGSKSRRTWCVFLCANIAQGHKYGHGRGWGHRESGTPGLRGSCSATLVSTQQSVEE